MTRDILILFFLLVHMILIFYFESYEDEIGEGQIDNFFKAGKSKLLWCFRIFKVYLFTVPEKIFDVFLSF